jgi:peptide/nickel transport system permease protein
MNSNTNIESFREFLKRSKIGKLVYYSLIFFFLISILADFIANDKPIYCNYKGRSYWPVFKEYGIKIGISKLESQFASQNWKEYNYEAVLWPLIPFAPKNLDFTMSNFISPTKAIKIGGHFSGHYLGTGPLGEDILSAIIHGVRYALFTGAGTLLISLFIGLTFGTIAGYFGDDSSKNKVSDVISIILFLFYSWYVAYYLNRFNILDRLDDGLILILVLLLKLIGYIIIIGVCVYFINKYILWKLPLLKIEIHFPLDLVISRGIEVFNALPKILILFAFLAFLKPSILNTILILGFISWPIFAQLIRAKILSIKKELYIESAKSSGIKPMLILFRHALPNSLGILWIIIGYSVSGAVLAESAIGYLGLGTPPEVLSWGKLLSMARENSSAWWMIFPSGFMLFYFIGCFNYLGKQASIFYNPKRSV